VPFEFCEDGVTSDVTFRASGGSLAVLFAAAVDGTTATMVADLDSVRASERRRVDVEADALDLLLLRLLEDVIFLKDTERLLLRAGEVRVDAEIEPRRARVDLVGEPIDRARHELLADVKAVTLHGLRVEQRDDQWQACVTLDV
jgi:SHS2 domain-containing protein